LARRRLGWDLEQLRHFQERKLKRILEHAYINVPYYKRLFDKTGIKPSDIKTLQDLPIIPITTRRDLQKLFVSDVVAKNDNIYRRKCLRTSGSLGIPLSVYIGFLDIPRDLSYLRMYFENGRKIRDKVLFITSRYNFSERYWFHQYLHNIGIMREKFISIEEPLGVIINEVIRYKPDIIMCYPSVIKDVAARIRKNKIKGVNPRIIFTTGEMLTSKDRIFIESVLGTEIVDYYSCNECGIIAWECREHSGYHIDNDNVIVELVKNGRPVRTGEDGEVVITTLNSYTMPFIRYKLGDMCMFADHECTCGNNFPLIETIGGRANDCILLPDGRRITPYTLMITMDNIREIVEYQIIQYSINKVEIKVVGSRQLSNAVIDKVRKAYDKIMGVGVEIEVRVCSGIGRSSNYKNRTIVSELQ